MATESNKNRVAYEFNPFTKTKTKKPENSRDARAAKREIADFVKESVLDFAGEGKSPVQGGKWKRSLSKEYRDRKGEFSSVDFSNLELEGEMLDSMVARVSGDKIILEIKGDQAGKADGNNRGSYGKSPDDKKAREFIPKRGQELKRSIMKEVKKIIEDFS